jgi:hypothetical protein
LERESDPALDEAHQLLAQNTMNRRESESATADAPMTGEDEEKAMPLEASGSSEGINKEGETGEAGQKMPGEEMPANGEPQFRPALGGRAPKLDPRLADKRPKPAKDTQSQPSPAQQNREALANRQFERLSDLNLSQQSLGADAASLEALMEQLEKALAGSEESMRSEAASSKGEEVAQAANEENLSNLLQSPEVHEAMALAQRLRQARNAPQGQQGQPQKGPAQTSRGLSLGNLDPTSTSGKIIEVELSKLDPQTRALILKMRPRMREELLQGMREQGPLGYRKFIEDYFKRLSEVKGN